MANGTITVTPANTVALTSPAGTDNQTVCINNAIASITYSTTGATGATVTGLPAGVNGVWAANAVTIAGTPTVSGTFNYTVTLTGGCGAVSAVGVINITPDNTVTLTSAAGTDNQTVCINNAITGITYSTTGATGATVTGLPAGVNGVWAANVVTISGTPTASGTFNYTVTLTGGCGVVIATGTINVTPDNTVVLTSAAGTDNQTLCINTAITNITYGTTGATGATVTGLPAGVNGVWATNVVTISGTPTASGTFNYTVTLTGGCGVITTAGVINVTPDNTVILTSPAGTDNQTLCISTPITNITYGTTGATGATVAGLPAGVNGVWAANIVTISGMPTISGTFNYTVTLTGGCGAVIATGVINVTPDNTVSLTSAAGTDNQTLCISTPITSITYATTGATGATVTGLPAGVNGVWAVNVVTISGTPTASGTFNYTVTLTGGCGAAVATGTITVTPDNVVTLTSVAGTDNQTVCINTAITDITYGTTGATGATVTGLPAGVTGTWAANVVTITGTPTVSGTFSYTITLTGGCGVITASGTINSTPDNTSVLTSAAGTDNQTVCINNAITDITYGTTGAAGATVTGLPAGVTGTWAANVVTITGTPTVAGTFSYTITLTGGCGVVTATGTIIVSDDNTVILTSAPGTDSQTLCINTALIDITYGTTGATGAAVTGLPAGVNGIWAANVVTLSGIPAASGTFNYTVTLTGGCGVVTASGTITVTPDNTVTLTSAAGTDNQSLCLGGPITDITYATTGATGATVTGLPAGITGTWAANVVTITGTPAAAGTFNYTVTLTGGCGTITANGSITVTVGNSLSLTSAAGTDSQMVCINTAITDITYGTTGATGATVTGLPAGVTGTWAANVVTITGSPSVPGIFNYTVTLTGGCGGLTANGTLTITPDNSVTLSSAAGTDSQTLCINTMITDITYATTGATGATVTGLPAGVNGVWAADVVTINGTPSASGTFDYTVTLNGGCGVITATGTITVTPDNTISLISAAGTDNQSVTITSAITDITYGTTGATGGAVSGLPAGVNGTWAANVVTITGTPAAIGTFNYTITLSGGCGSVTDTGTITVNTLPSVVVTNPAAVCSPLTVDITAPAVTAGSTPGLTLTYWTDAAATIPYVTPATTTTGTYYIKGTDGSGFSDIQPVVVIVNASPTVTVAITGVLCNGTSSGAVDLTVAGGVAPYTFLWSNSATTEDISGLIAGSYSVTVTDSIGCSANVAADVTEPAKLSIEETHTDAKCPGEDNGSITLTITGGVQPYSILWYDGLTTATRAAKDTTYIVKVTDANGCSDSLDIIVGISDGSNCIQIPEVITPNGDGKNDTWIIKNIGMYPNAEVLVYSRWGELVFRTKNISANPWDGRYRGKLVPVDSYHYILYLNDGSKPRTGVITVLR